jgi:hypothetical protein
MLRMAMAPSRRRRASAAAAATVAFAASSYLLYALRRPAHAEKPPAFSAAAPSPSPSPALPEEPRAVRNDLPRTSAAGFDPEALERGAKALREINSSGNAKKVGSLFRLPTLQAEWEWLCGSLSRSTCRIVKVPFLFPPMRRNYVSGSEEYLVSSDKNAEEEIFVFDRFCLKSWLKFAPPQARNRSHG